MVTTMNRQTIFSLFACLLLTLLASSLVEASSSNYTLATAAKDKHTDAFLNADITYNGTTATGNPWAQYTVPSNADINVTHAMSGYYADTDIYFFDSELPNCGTTPTCTIENNGYQTDCTNASDSSTGVYTERYSCQVQKNNVVFSFTYYPASNGVLTTNQLVSTSYTAPEIENLGANMTQGLAPLTVRFEPNITFSNGAAVQAIEWEFGDGSPVSNEYNTTHTFSAVGNYTVQLTVYDDNGLMDRETMVVTVRPLPVVTFTADQTTITAGQNVTLTWTTQYADNVTIDNGIGAVEANGNRTVAPNTTTTYTLIAFNADGNTTRSVTLTVTENENTNGGGGGSGSTSTSSGRRGRSSGGGGPISVVIPVTKEPVPTTDSTGPSEAVDILSVAVPELHVNQPASILVTLQSQKKMNISVQLLVDEMEIETVSSVIDGTQEIEFIYIPTMEGEHEFVVVLEATDGTESWSDTVVVQPAVIEQNITTGMSLSNLFKPLYIILLLSAVAIGVAIWKRDEIRAYLNI